MLAALMVFACCSCKQNEPEPDNVIELTPAVYHASSYRVNEWRVEGTKDYYTILATYASDFYGIIEECDILYYTNNYIPFKEAFPDSNITIYNTNSSQTGIGAYIKIHTNQLIVCFWE